VLRSTFRVTWWLLCYMYQNKKGTSPLLLSTFRASEASACGCN
jgi:hypothetical protein